MARRKNSNEAIESVEPTDIEMDVENEEYDSQENVNEETEINTEIESTQSSESETEPAENSEPENSDSDENPDNSADSVEPENIENVNETEDGDNTEETNVEDYKAISRRELIAQKNKNEQERAEKNALREERIMKWEQIRTSRRENRIVYGNLISIETLNNTMIVGVVKFGEYRIIIPASEMFKNDLVDYSTIEDIDDKIKRENQMMSKLLGLEIPFVITQVTGKFDGEYAILASRKLALRRIETYNFKTSKHQKEALVKEKIQEDVKTLNRKRLDSKENKRFQESIGEKRETTSDILGMHSKNREARDYLKSDDMDMSVRKSQQRKIDRIVERDMGNIRDAAKVICIFGKGRSRKNNFILRTCNLSCFNK